MVNPGGFGIRRWVVVLALPGLLLLLSGCSWRVIPPEVDGPVAPVLLSAYSKHTRIAFPLGDATYVEYGFGDWDYYALDDTRAWSAVRAAFFSEASALSRRLIPWEGDVGQFRNRAGAMRTELVLVDAAQAAALLESLEATWNALEGEEAFRDWEGLSLRKWDARYHLFRNSNHQAASWMEQLGCGIKGHALTNDFAIEKPEGLQEDGNNAKR